jgi:hypothetical protein
MPDDHCKQPAPKTQLTQPKGIDPKTGKPYEPIEIPIPTRGDFEELIGRAVKHRPVADLDSAGSAVD